MTTKQMIIETTINELNSIYCIYELLTIPGQPPTHAGYCKLQDIFKQRVPVGKDAPFMISLLTMHTDEREAMNAAFALRTSRGIKLIIEATGKCIRCIETGEMFYTSADACRVHGISSSALSNHLNGKRYCRTVKGKTYERITTAHATDA